MEDKDIVDKHKYNRQTDKNTYEYIGKMHRDCGGVRMSELRNGGRKIEEIKQERIHEKKICKVAEV